MLNHVDERYVFLPWTQTLHQTRTDHKKTWADDVKAVARNTSISCKLLCCWFCSKCYEHESWFCVPGKQHLYFKFLRMMECSYLLLSKFTKHSAHKNSYKDIWRPENFGQICQKRFVCRQIRENKVNCKDHEEKAVTNWQQHLKIIR